MTDMRVVSISSSNSVALNLHPQTDIHQATCRLRDPKLIRFSYSITIVDWQINSEECDTYEQKTHYYTF